MAISYKSKLYDSERIFTVAIDWYQDRPIEGVLYQGEQPTGVCFSGYHELARMMEQHFAQMQYPRSVMDRRGFFSARGDMEKREAIREIARRDGRTGTYTIRVMQRQNASWQGNVKKNDGELFDFTSFLQLVSYLEGDLSSSPDKMAVDGREGCQQRVERYLRIVMNCPEVMKVLPDTLVYRFFSEGKSQTFMIRPMFYEHNTCQGTVYWKEYRRQVSFRSFLELISIMGNAIRYYSSWDGQVEAI